MSVTALVTAEVAKLVPTITASVQDLRSAGAVLSKRVGGRYMGFNPGKTTLRNDGRGYSVDMTPDSRDAANVRHQMAKTQRELTSLQPQQRNPFMMGKRPGLMPRVHQNPFRARIMNRADAVVARNTPRKLRYQMGWRMRMLKEASSALTQRTETTVSKEAIQSLALQQAMVTAPAPAQRSARTKHTYEEMMRTLMEPVPSKPSPTQARGRRPLHQLAA